MEDEDEIEILYHGTTRSKADHIIAQKKFSQQQTFFSPIPEVAAYFARRAVSRGRPDDAVVIEVRLYKSDLDDWRQSRIVLRKPFDEADKPELRNKIQLVFSPTAVDSLNKYSFSNEWRVLTLPLPG